MPSNNLQWRVFSPAPVIVDGVPPDLTIRCRLVLLRLLIDANQYVAIDQLIDFLWGEHPPRTARNSVSRFVADIRRALGEHRDSIETGPLGYRVVVTKDSFDLYVVTAILREFAAVDMATAVELQHYADRLRTALELAGTDPNPLFAEVPHATGVHQRANNELRIAVLEAFVEVGQRQGEHQQLVALLRGAVAANPYHERLWQLLMLSLDALGRPTEALRAAQELREVLKDIGLTPSAGVEQAELAILAAMGEWGSDVLPAAAATTQTTASTHGITDPGTMLVGRTDELRELHGAMRSHRLVSIVGIGGAGKTRLALAAVRAQRTSGMPIHQVGLRNVSDPALVAATIGATMGVSPAEGVVDGETLAAAIGPDPFLLILDNCEHVRHVAADVVRELLRALPDAHILTTSRQALGIKGEYLFMARPLQTSAGADPSGRSSAVDLFLDRARADLDAGELSTDDLSCAHDICCALGGLPLAIEVAAAQLAYMTLSELHARMVVADSGGSSRADEAAVTVLTDVLDWSWTMLSVSQQTVLARLSVFTGSLPRAAIEPVVGAAPSTIADDLEQLINSSLIVETESDGALRFELLAPVRDFALQRLSDRGEVGFMRDQLAAWVVTLVEQWGFVEHHAVAEASRTLLPEHGNIIAALTHLRDEGRKEELAQLALRTNGMWNNHRFPHETVRWLGPLVDDPAVSDAARSGAAAALVMAYHTTGELDLLTPYSNRAFELAAGRPLDWLPWIAGYLSMSSLSSVSLQTTDEYSAMSFELAAQSASPKLNTAIAAMLRGNVMFLTRRYDEALALFSEARSLVDQPGRLFMHIEVGESLSLYMCGRRVEAAEAAEHWTSQPETDHWHYIVEIARAVIVGGAGQAERATAQLAEAVRRSPAAMVWGQSGVVQAAFALLADFRGEHDLARQLFADAVNRDILLLAVTIEHVLESRGLESEEDWLGVALEFWSRVVPEGALVGDAKTMPELLDFWSRGGGQSDDAPPIADARHV